MKKTSILLGVTALLSCGATWAGGAGPEPLALRVNDATVVPGGLAAVVMRTYASRPIRQGQICFVARSLRSPLTPSGSLTRAGGVTGGGPFVGLESAVVFSAAGDVIETVEFTDGDAQVTELSFSSKSASVNVTDGPLLALFYRARSDLVPGERIDLQVDAANTTLFDEQGQPIVIEGRNGELFVRAPSDPVSLSIDSEDPANGHVRLGLQTDEVLEISAGQFGLRHAPVLTGSPKVYVDPRYGDANLTVSWVRGLIVVQFESTGNDLGWLPGDIVGLFMEIAAGSGAAADRSIWLDPAYTFLYDGNGATMTLTLEGDVIP